MFASKKKGETVKLGKGKSVFVPSGKQVCHGCGGHKTKTMGSNCFTCNGKGYV